jgi:hypothetical protein
MKLSSKAKGKIRSLPEDTKLLVYIFLLLFIVWIIFDSIKYSWSDDPFQKVVLAPLGEEPFKLLLALMLCSAIVIGGYIPQVLSKRIKKPKWKMNFIDLFSYSFVPFAIISAIIFGLTEGPINNILLHFSTTTIAAILLVIIYRKVKTKDWKFSYKLLAVFSTIGVPMFFHSISNQYANICVANNQPRFEYLVIIARFLENNTILTNQVIFTRALFLIAYGILVICLLKYIILLFIVKRLGKDD